MYLVQCNGCRAQAFIDCGCPPGVSGGHLAACPLSNVDAQVTCLPGSPCCKIDHDHGAAADACAGEHKAGTCPSPSSCALWAGVPADARAAAGLAEDGDCPGGHCALGIDGCTVCRALTVTVMPGSTSVSIVAGV